MNSSLKNGLLMLAPCALLVGVGFLLKNRKPAVFTVKTSGPFKTYIKAVCTIPITPGEVQDGYDTKVEVELGASGQPPAWWQKGFGGYTGKASGQLVARKEGTARPVGQTPFCWHPHFDANSKRWISTYTFKLVPLNAGVGDIHLRDRVQVMGAANTPATPPMWLDYKVRAQSTSTQVPAVSHDPHITLRRLVIEQEPPVDSQGGDKYRIKLWFNKQGPLKGLESYGVNDSLKICDSKGHTSSFGGGMYGREEFDDNSYEGSPKPVTYWQNERHVYNAHDFILPYAGSGDGGSTMQHPLTIQGEAQFGPNWPMWIKVPLTDDQGKLLLSPRSKPAFHVISTAARKANASEKANSGADTIVDVTLAGIAPQVDVTKWKWQGNFSQHVEASKAFDIWTFPLKGGANPAMVSYIAGTKQMTIRYDLNIGSIPASAGNLTLVAGISGNNSTYLPVRVAVRSAVSKPAVSLLPPGTPISTPTPGS